ncbi:MAG TPA: glycosyltransferase family 2 protein [Synechococcales cyanobacterium M55_K2018_004]|nr:glycosyltransferase family 2 protein [Synechococcales cyanobacterium M55_K2018_004]
MKDNPRVSIIINNYNYAQYLPTAIASALDQTYRHIEVIVVDDCSTDGSREVIQRYGDRIVPIFHDVNGKQGAALNSGFAASQGEIVMFLDADDYLFPDAVERIVAVWKPGISKVHFRLQVVDGEGNPLGYCIPSIGNKLPSGAIWQQLLETSSYVSSPMSGNAYWKAAIASAFPIAPDYATTADDYLMISSPFYGELVGINDCLGAYRVHTSNQWALTSVSGSRFRRFVQHDLQNFALLQQRAREFNHEIPPDLELRSLGRVWSRLASLRLEPQEHPVPTDNVTYLVCRGVRSLWFYSHHNRPKRILYSLFFVWIGYMPVPLAKMALTYLYAPHLRPQVVDLLLKRLRSLMSRDTGAAKAPTQAKTEESTAATHV